MSVAREQEVLSRVPTSLLIDGQWVESSSGERLRVEDPATGEQIATIADASVTDGDAALAAASRAQEKWAATAPRERGELLRSVYEKLIENVEDLALLMTLEMGKSLVESRAEIRYAAEFFRWFSEEAVRIAGRYYQAPAGGSRILTLKQPVGPALLITPWNFPMAMGARKIAPALAAGCTAVVKPAAQTPLSMLALASIMCEVGVPDGVVNVIPTSSSDEVTEPLLRDRRLRKLSFTGSTSVGRLLIERSAQQVLRVSMELGGNAPFLVFDDADIDAAVKGAIVAKMRNIGEACTAANRFHVHESVAEDFTRRLVDEMARLRLGRGTEPDVDVGPLISENQRQKVEDLVSDAANRGAEIKLGGQRWGSAGYFYEPTVITNVPSDAKILAEEVFGPVAVIATFTTDDEAIAQANNTEYGLVAYVFTRDVERAFKVCEGLQTGMVGLDSGKVSNPAAPFGGIKASGFGREGSVEGIDEYLETKYVSLPASLPN